MSEGGIEKGSEKIKEKLVKIEDFTTLKELCEGSEKVDEGYEGERRYEPTRHLSEGELRDLSGDVSFYITQVYVDALDKKGVKLRFRLRITQEGDEPPHLRIAYKQLMQASANALRPIGKIERQMIFDEDDPRAEEFDQLWKHRKRGWFTLYKTRYYMPFVLPNGNTAEIHYDVLHGPPDTLDGYHRIEIELHGKLGDTTGASVEADAAHLGTAEGRAAANLPEWIGEDVTGRPEYNSKRLARYGSVEKARESLAKKEKEKE